MRKYSVVIFGVAMLLIASNTCFSQKYSIGIESGIQWHSPDFYLNYKAVSNPDLKVRYDDGTINNRIETYNFSPFLSTALRFTQTIRDPRKRGAAISYSAGLGYSQTGFVIIEPISVAYHDTLPLMMASYGREERYYLGYLSIPLGVKKTFARPSGRGYLALGAELHNYILVSRKGYNVPYADLPQKPLANPRLSAARDYWISVSVRPEAGIRIWQKCLVTINGRIGITPMNLLKYDELMYQRGVGISIRQAGAYEQTQKINFFYGGGLSIAYQIN